MDNPKYLKWKIKIHALKSIVFAKIKQAT